MASRDESDDKFDWSKTWVAEMFMSSEDAVRQKAMLDQLQGKTPETRRRNEIKGGIITASAGVSLMIVLFVLMNGIILSGRVSDAAIEILSRIWIVGLIPVFVGIALIFNGIFVSRRGVKAPVHDTAAPDSSNELRSPETPAFLSPADTTDLASGIPFSVTDETTKHLKQPVGHRRDTST